MTTKYVTVKLTLREAWALSAAADVILSSDDQDFEAVFGEQKRNHNAAESAGRKLDAVIANADPTMGAQFIDKEPQK